MFWKKKSANEDNITESKPKEVPSIVQNYMVASLKVDKDYTPLFKSVTRKNGGASYNIRIYDESDALARGVTVANYSMLDQKPEIVIYEGTYDEAAKKVELAVKNSLFWDTQIYTEAEVTKKIESLTQPGSSIFFYQSRGGNTGGPLGKGANIIELSPAYPGKGKKYNIYTVNVIGTEPQPKGEKMFDSNKAKEIAKWVVQGHHRREYC